MEKNIYGLESIRKARGLNRRELELLSGVKRLTILTLEHDYKKLYVAKLETLVKLAKALRVKVSDLFPNGKIF